MKVVDSAGMRVLEQAAVEAGATWPALMERAGGGVAAHALAMLGSPAGRGALVLVGPGNNGGDGLVVARLLHDAGADVALYLWRRQRPEEDANWRLCRERRITELSAADDPGRAGLRRLLAGADLVVDALLGIGVTRPVAGELAEIVGAVNERRAAPGNPPAVLSVDVPTGIDADSGAVLGAAIRADLTVATGLLKPGLLLFPGRAYAGALQVADIELIPADVEAIMTETIGADLARGLLPARPDDSHKGTFGKVMVVAGSAQYPGAAVLASAGAARAGAGLVTLATGRSGALAGGRPPEITVQPLPEAEWGVLGEAAADELLKAIEGYTALVVGPGLGREKPTGEFLSRLLGLDAPRQRGQIGFRIGGAVERQETKERAALPPAVLDADALTLLAGIAGWWERVPRGSLVLTPHPGEMKRLLGDEELPADPRKAAGEAAARWGQIVVLKGATTVVAEPEGRLHLNDGGNAALATAGTGDVLAGAIGGLLAQGLAPFDAASLGVYLHSAAGRLVREELGDMGALASDLLPRLPLAAKQLRGGR
jgi:ADP-dependent NAD(P)H-hydrate dehydratase / NAD(P)H-hydrate epimerase